MTAYMGALTRNSTRDPKCPYRPGSVMHQSWVREQRDIMRANPTPEERQLRDMLEGDERTKGQWVHQPIALGFVPDFGHERAQIIVELDGEVHKQTSRKRADAIRDNVFRKKGFAVLRFTNAQLICHPREVFEKIVATQCARLDGNKRAGIAPLTAEAA